MQVEGDVVVVCRALFRERRHPEAELSGRAGHGLNSASAVDDLDPRGAAHPRHAECCPQRLVERFATGGVRGPRCGAYGVARIDEHTGIGRVFTPPPLNDALRGVEHGRGLRQRVVARGEAALEVMRGGQRRNGDLRRQRPPRGGEHNSAAGHTWAGCCQCRRKVPVTHRNGADFVCAESISSCYAQPGLVRNVVDTALSEDEDVALEVLVGVAELVHGGDGHRDTGFHRRRSADVAVIGAFHLKTGGFAAHMSVDVSLTPNIDSVELEQDLATPITTRATEAVLEAEHDNHFWAIERHRN
eukprot:PhM_4_TR7551/c0_g1_i1/m.4529